MSNLGLDIAASGISAQQSLLDTAAQNLANVSTPGYAQETVNLTTQPSESASGVGEGVLITSVTGQTSDLFESLNDIAAGQLGAANQAQSVQNAAQEAFPEPSTTGLSSQLDQLFSDLSSLATEPSNSAAAATVVQDASQVASTLNSTYQQLATTSSQLLDDLQGTGGSGEGLLGQANQLINQIAQLNTGIMAGVGGNDSPNGLIDQRRQAVNQLANLLGVTATSQSNGSLTVSLNGVQLVSGTTASDLQTAGGSGGTPLTLQTAGGAAAAAGGEIGSLLTGYNTTIPTYQAQLSGVSDALATSLNALQSGGVSANGTPGPTSSAATGWTGSLLPGALFVNEGSSTTYTTGAASAATIAVNPSLLSDPSLLATASGSSTAGQPTIDATTVQQMAAVGQQSGGPTTLYQSLVGLVGSQTQQANDVQASAQTLSDNATANLSSVEGVDTNTQTVNVLSAQDAYQATAQVISAINDSLQSLLEAV
ncbi:MAG TPA: flagellar hook-associated protein FlgK [Acidimicrobiales bacterium]|nr:flagellar hook-associated protein FlgK [Acidimicrobiales bacterium]